MEAFLSYTIAGLNISNIVIAVSILLVSFLIKNILSKTILNYIKMFTKKTKNTIDDKLVDILELPIKLSIILIGFFISINFLSISRFNGAFNSFTQSFAIFIIFLVLYKTLEQFSNIINKFSKKFGKKISSDIENFLIKTFKIVIIAIGIMTILNEWGINISAFVASLGLVGMALALAAKDTAANLFGSLVIFTDRPFNIGDWIQTPNVEGTVEDIGIRSTKVRTFSQALTNVPNAVIANSAITNWSKIGKRRIKMRLGLTYKTSTKQMQKILVDLREMLKNHNDIHKDTIMVHFDEFQDSSLSLFCYFFTNTTAWAKYLAVREDINLKIMKIIEDNGAGFAFPSQSVYIESMPNDNMI